MRLPSSLPDSGGIVVSGSTVVASGGLPTRDDSGDGSVEPISNSWVRTGAGSGCGATICRRTEKYSGNELTALTLRIRSLMK
jgi:hypothetical protein